MKFSIVTISFNQATHLGEAIKSVLGQRDDGIVVEYIVVDPGSTDGSREVLDKYRRGIDRLVLEPDDGPADGLNKGFKLATGDVFGFINADDYLHPGALRRVTEYLDSNPHIDAVRGGLHIRREGSKRKDTVVLPSPYTPQRLLDGRTQTLQQSTFFRRRAWERTSGFNRQNSTSWDGELFADMLLADARFGQVSDVLATFRIHDSSISGSGRLNEQYVDDSARIRRKLVTAGYRPTPWPLDFAVRLGWRVRPITRLRQRWFLTVLPEYDTAYRR